MTRKKVQYIALPYLSHVAYCAKLSRMLLKIYWGALKLRDARSDTDGLYNVDN